MSQKSREYTNSEFQQSEIAVGSISEAKSDEIKVSVIIPVYKVEEYIERCLDSVLNQTLKEMEFIFVDDCGGDESIAIVEKRAAEDDRIRIIYNEKNLGEGKSRNRGIEAAKGKYIGFVDSDDTVDLNFFETLYLKAEEYDSDVVKGQRLIIYPDSSEEKSALDEGFRKDIEYVEREDWCLKFPQEHTTAIYRRSLLEDNQIKYTNLLVDADTFFLLQVTTCTKKIAVCWGVYYYYYKRDNSSSTTFSSEYFKAKIKQLEMKIDYLNTVSLNAEISASYVVQRFGAALTHYRTLLKQCYYSDPKSCELFLMHIKQAIDKYKYKGAFKKKVSEDLRRYRIFNELEQKEKQHKSEIIPEISVILPVFNEEKYLGKCLTSLLEQTFEYFEVICIDDGSTDKSEDILFAYMTRSLKIKLYRQENKGAGAARNYGLTMAKGRYVMFLDSDDYFEKNMLMDSYARAVQTSADITVFGSKIRDEETGKFTDCTWAFKKNALPAQDTFAFTDILQNPFRSFTWRAWDKLYKKSFVLSNELRFQELRTTNDLFFVLTSFMKAEKITVIDKPLYIQRRNIPTSLQATRELSWECFYYALIRIRETLISMEIYEKYRYQFINYALNQCLWQLNTIKYEAAKKLLLKLKKEWFWELEILNYGPEFYESTSDYEQFIDIMNASVMTNEADILWKSYKINTLLRKNAYLNSSQREIRITSTESLTEEKLINILQWNREKRNMLESKIKLLEKQPRGIDTAQYNKILHQLDNANHEIDAIRSSLSFKIGRFVTWFPRKIRALFKGNKRKNIKEIKR